MKNTIVKVVAAVMLLSLMAGLFSGCILTGKTADGPGMVNYPGIMLDELRGAWYESDDGSYSIMFYDDYTFSLSCNYEPLLENAVLTLYLDNMNTDEYSEFDVKPNAFTDQAGNSVEITKGSHENGAVTLELAAADGTMSTMVFYRMPEDTDAPELLDGDGMYYYGGILDEALTGGWQSEDGRFALDFDGKYADFTADGMQLASKDNGYFVDHGFSQDDDLNERCELYPYCNLADETDEPPLTISEMWYQAEHIYMSVVRADGTVEEVVFSRQDEAVLQTETSAAAQSEAVPTE